MRGAGLQWEIKIKILGKRPGTWSKSKKRRRRVHYVCGKTSVLPKLYCNTVFFFPSFSLITQRRLRAYYTRFLYFSLLCRFSFVPRSDFNLLLCFWKEMLSFCVCLPNPHFSPYVVVFAPSHYVAYYNHFVSPVISHYFRPLCKLFPTKRTCSAVQMTVKTLVRCSSTYIILYTIYNNMRYYTHKKLQPHCRFVWTSSPAGRPALCFTPQRALQLFRAVPPRQESRVKGRRR